MLNNIDKKYGVDVVILFLAIILISYHIFFVFSSSEEKARIHDVYNEFYHFLNVEEFSCEEAQRSDEVSGDEKVEFRFNCADSHINILFKELPAEKNRLTIYFRSEEPPLGIEEIETCVSPQAGRCFLKVTRFFCLSASSFSEDPQINALRGTIDSRYVPYECRLQSTQLGPGGGTVW